MGRTNEHATTGQRERDKDRPAVWSAYGKLVRLFRERVDLTQQALADAVGYSLEQVASVEQGRGPAKATFTEAAERVLDAGGALRVLQEDVDRALRMGRRWRPPQGEASSPNAPRTARRIRCDWGMRYA